MSSGTSDRIKVEVEVADVDGKTVPTLRLTGGLHDEGGRG
jgi:hypothetical protein